MAGQCRPCSGGGGTMVKRLMGVGPLELAGHDECTERYSGQAMVVCVVDRLGPNQRIFPGYSLSEAAVVASQQGASLETIDAHRLCAAALVGVTPS